MGDSMKLIKSKEPKFKTINENLRVDYEILGLAGLLSPFAAFNSSQRLMMYSSHLNSCLSPINPEFPDTYSGFEFLIGDYTYKSFTVKEDIEIVKVIPKFRRLPLDLNPLITVIYRKLNSGELDYVNLYKYIRTKENFGFKNDFSKLNLIQEGAIFSSGMELVHPTTKDPDSGEYCMGVNANVAYISLLDTYEDAFVISESLMKKLGATFIETVYFEIDFDKYPLNLWGNDEEYKVFLDIGDTIDDSGIIAAFRKIKNKFIITDLNPIKLKEPNFIHDRILFGRPGATIVDIDVFMDHSIKLLKDTYDQFKKYFQYKLEYYKDIYQIYLRYYNDPISERLNTLFTKAIRYLIAGGVEDRTLNSISHYKNIKYERDGQPIKLYTKITYVYDLNVTVGYKLTGRDGAKGVIGIVVPDEYMPVDSDGVRADLLIDSASVIKRTNISQLFEQFFSRASMNVLMKIKDKDLDTQFNTILDYLNDVDPSIAELVRQEYSNRKEEFINECFKDNIKLWINPSNRNVNIERIKYISDKWDVKAKPVKFHIKNKLNEYIPIAPHEKIFIGRKYIYLLHNLPNINTIAVGITNQYDIPVKTSKKKKAGVSITPTRFFGEDETRIMFNTSFPDEMTRLRCLQAFSREGIKELVRTLLTSEHPTRIQRVNIDNQTLKDSSVILNTLHCFFNILGIDIKNSKIHK